VISEAELERVLDWLVQNAGKAAKARAERIYLDEYRKSLKSILMAKSGATSVAAQEVDAYRHPEYLIHLEAIRTAVEVDEKFRWLQVAAEAKIEIFRTEAANARASGKIA
jgi:hypothetical protein